MFKPKFTITPKIATILMELKGLQEKINFLPITPKLLISLKESARLSSIHYSTMIEGNRLTQEEIAQTIEQKTKLAGRERDQNEVLGYYEAMTYVEKAAKQDDIITELHVKKIHALVMSGGNKKAKPTQYRTAQNVIREAGSNAIVYLPPEPADVPTLMQELITWIQKNPIKLPAPIVAGIAHYQFAIIHPYIDGNGRTARLLTTLILRLSEYDLKGIYSLDEYYAKDLFAYYQALSIGPSHNYYMGRAESDITSWIEYFCSGMLQSFKNIERHASRKANTKSKDQSTLLRKLDMRQRAALSLFNQQEKITSHDIATLFKIPARSARLLCQNWVEDGFLIITDHAKKSRKYELSPTFHELLD